jgi:DNA-binding IscR family transcriptional regulator
VERIVSSLSPEQLAFIRRSLKSVWALELLLLLRADRERGWTTAELVSELRANDSLVTRILEDFRRHGLVGGEGGWRYAAKAPDADLCDQIEALYRERPMTLIKAISTPPDRLQALADAFRIKKGDDT